jgi:hypothetical protein
MGASNKSKDDMGTLNAKAKWYDKSVRQRTLETRQEPNKSHTKPHMPLMIAASNLFCQHQEAFWLALILCVAFIAIATAIHVKSQCWRWRTDPVGAAALDLRSHGDPVPYSYYNTPN